jgi:hypothetical protein
MIKIKKKLVVKIVWIFISFMVIFSMVIWTVGTSFTR